MKENRRPRLGVLAIALWWSSGSVVEAQPPIRIGASMSQSGSLAVPGQNQLRGYQLCVKHANEKAGVLGRRIELHVEDDQSKGPTAAAVYEKELHGTELSYHSAQGYGGCQVFMEAIKRAGSLDSTRLRDAILKLEFNTVFGAFKVDPDGLQIAQKNVLFQWQDGKKVVVWPEEIAPVKPRFPTPPWSQRQ